jgi:hypothetical protein
MSAKGHECSTGSPLRKGSERRKVFAKQDPEGGRKPLKAGGQAFGASLALPPCRRSFAPMARSARERGAETKRPGGVAAPRGPNHRR